MCFPQQALAELNAEIRPLSRRRRVRRKSNPFEASAYICDLATGPSTTTRRRRSNSFAESSSAHSLPRIDTPASLKPIARTHPGRGITRLLEAGHNNSPATRGSISSDSGVEEEATSGGCIQKWFEAPFKSERAESWISTSCVRSYVLKADHTSRSERRQPQWLAALSKPNIPKDSSVGSSTDVSPIGPEIESAYHCGLPSIDDWNDTYSVLPNIIRNVSREKTYS